MTVRRHKLIAHSKLFCVTHEDFSQRKLNTFKRNVLDQDKWFRDMVAERKYLYLIDLQKAIENRYKKNEVFMWKYKEYKRRANDLST